MQWQLCYIRGSRILYRRKLPQDEGNKKFWLAPAFVTIKLSKAPDKGFGNSDEDINKKIGFCT